MSAANDRVEKLLGKLEVAWTDFHGAYSNLTDEQLHQPGVTGEWSIRDLIAHVTWWDKEALKHLPLILEGGRPPRYSVKYGGIDAFNAMMTERNRGLSLQQVRDQSEATHRRLVDYLLSLEPEEIMANDRFKRRLRLDSYGHYPIHTADIHTWRQRQSGRETLSVRTP